MTFRIGIIGDLHTHWDEVDVVQFNRSDYDLLLFTGDLGAGLPAAACAWRGSWRTSRRTPW